MKKKIRRITRFVTLLIWLISHQPTLVIASSPDQGQQGRFWDKHEKFPLHFGPKLWFKLPIRTIGENMVVGTEAVIGAFIEYKRWNGIGIQIGCVYGKTMLLTSENKQNANKENSPAIEYKAISFPLSIRFYLGEARKWVLHAGHRWMVAVSNIESGSFGMRSGTFSIVPDSALNNPLAKIKKVHCCWDLGFEFNAASGFIIGTHGMGITLGYDFAKLFFK